VAAYPPLVVETPCKLGDRLEALRATFGGCDMQQVGCWSLRAGALCGLLVRLLVRPVLFGGAV